MHLENTDETFVIDLCNIRVQPLQYIHIPIYFCNIHLKHLPHTSETSETLETYACNTCFQQNMAVRQRSTAQRDPGCAVTVEEDGSGRAAAWPPAIGRMQWRRQ